MTSPPADYGHVLAAVKATAEAHAKALLDLGAVMVTAGVEPHRDFAAIAKRIEANAAVYVKWACYQVDMARRPKGPSIRITSGDKVVEEELLRVTATQAITLDSHGECRYSLSTGSDVRRGVSATIHSDDMTIARSMKSGPNDVSKARDAAIEKANKS